MKNDPPRVKRLRQAHAVYGDERYLRALRTAGDYEKQREVLFFPR